MEFRLLGTLEVEAGGVNLTPARPKQRALLALLLLHAGEAVATDDLIEALWGERPPDTAQTALQGHISALRKRIGAERIETRPPGYLLRLDDEDELDLRRFERLAEEAPAHGRSARSEQLREALALFRGEPLADFRYEAFASPEATRLEELRLAVLEEQIQSELELGRYVEVVPELERLIAENPLREGLRGQLMLALYRAGRQADALRAFQEARGMFVDELGIEPSAALQRLERQILNQDPELAAPDAFAPALHPSAGTKPVGIVTFLFTVVGDSARGTVRTVAGQHGGFEVETEGNHFLAAFARARDAVAAAVGIQRAAASDSGFCVGINSVEASSTDQGYAGPGVRGTAAIWSAGHGGQILLSQTTRDLLRETQWDEANVRELGEHRLRDLAPAQPLFELVAPELESEFEPPRGLETLPTNLPVQPTPLVGREREIRGVTHLLSRPEVRLLTLTGTGGTGKTRLAVHAAAELLGEFPDGVFFVGLAPLADPDLVLATLARTIGVFSTGSATLADAVARYLRDRRLLLVLDNFEHVLEAAPAVAKIAATAAAVKLLVTSRAPLAVDGEHVHEVPPLGMPDAADDVERLVQCESVALFASRAQAVRPEFSVTAANATPVAEICRALDGLPLAIELAATRVGVLPAASLLGRLDHRLKLLRGGPPHAPERQRTLRATIDWSFDLLEPEQQRLFVRLAVFAGGCTLEAAEGVCGADLDVVDGLASLTENGLARLEGTDEEPRFAMLETIREYAGERLAERGEATDAGQRHAEYFLQLAETHSVPFALLDFPKDDLAWFDREHDNLRAALDWFSERTTDSELEVRLANACTSFWYHRGYWSEGRRRLASASARSGVAGTATRPEALLGTAFLVGRQGDAAQAKALAEEALGLLRELGGHERPIRKALLIVSHCEHDLGNRGRAVRIAESLVAPARADGDEHGVEIILNVLGNFALEERDFARARKQFVESSKIARRLGIHTRLANALVDLGFAALGERDVDAAAPALQESLALARAEREIELMLWGVEGIAAVAVERSSEREAVVLLAATAGRRTDLGVGENHYSIADEVQGRTLGAARAALDDAA